MKIIIKGPIISNADKEVYDYFGLDSCCPADVINKLNMAGGQRIIVEINSGGGDVFAGSEIYTALRGYNGQVVINVVGLAASAASVIAMAGKCEMSPTSMMMIHTVSCTEYGDYRQMEHTSDVLRNANDAIAAAYCDKTGMNHEDILSIMDAETWLTAEKAVSLGFADNIMFQRFAASVDSGLLPRTVIDETKKALNEKGNLAQIARCKLDFLKLRGEEK